MTTAAATLPVAGVAVWRDVVALLKLRIGALVVTTAVAAAIAAGSASLGDLVVLALACLAASCGASALNHYLDRDLDARMARTATRPLPAGRLRPRAALWLGVGLVTTTLLAAPALGWVAVAYLLAGASTYALVYTAWLKRRTPYSIVVGGAAGSFAALAGWQSVATTWDPAPQLLAVVLLLWTPSHFWSLAIALERDYRAAGVPALSALVGARRTAAAVELNTLALVASSVALAAYLEWPYAVVAIPAGLGFVACTRRLRREPTRERAFVVFKLSGLYLLALLAGLVLSALV